MSGTEERGSQPSTPDLDIDGLIADPATRILLCCGSGGVGKTTTAAALAVRAAEAGRNTVVLTIDPARRLAQSLGLGELDNDPRPVAGIDASAGGSLDAMMLDMKRTFDEVVLAHSSPERAQEILANPIYRSLSSSFAGTQEYMAMEKLGQLVSQQRWDLIIVDTPPSRSALDFLDAPQRLGTFLDGRFLRVLTAPVRGGGWAYQRVLGAGFGMVTGVLNKVLGSQLLHDLQVLVSALESMFGGFRQRAEETYRLLKQPGTRFLVVAAAEPDALREAMYFVERLSADSMPLAGVVLNRMHRSELPGLSEDQALAGAVALSARDLITPAGEITAGLLRVHAGVAGTASREAGHRASFREQLPHVEIAEIPAQAGDVADLNALRALAASVGPSAQS